MGWHYERKPDGLSLSEDLAAKFSFETETQSSVVLDCALAKLRVAYMAVRTTIKNTGNTRVHGLICRVDYRPDEYFSLGLKDMDESEHPYYYDCPARILDLLSPTDDPNALRWRESCRREIAERKAAAPLKSGHYLILNSPLRFADGSSHTRFFIRDARRRIFTAHTDGHQMFQLPGRPALVKIGYSVVAPDKA